MPIVRFETKSANPLVLIPEPKFSGRTLYAEVFLSSFSVRVFELSTNSMRIKFPKFEECIDLLSKEILSSKQKVTLVGEGLFSGMVFELLKKCPQAIEAACILDPPLSRNEENFFRLPKNVEWILERFPRFYFRKNFIPFTNPWKEIFNTVLRTAIVCPRSFLQKTPERSRNKSRHSETRSKDFRFSESKHRIPNRRKLF